MCVLACSVGSFAPPRYFGLSFPSSRRILRLDLAWIFMRSSTMLRCIPLRLALPVVLAAALLPSVAFAQSQDSQSVAEAARRAREKKKAPAKPAKVITDDTLDVKKGDVQSATAEQLRIPGSPETSAQPAAGAANAQVDASAPAASASQTPDAKDQKNAKEIAKLKDQVKQAQGDLDLLQREQSLEQDNYYSNTDYARDTSGKAKLDTLKQQISDKQQELERLKTRLAELLAAQSASAGTPPKP